MLIVGASPIASFWFEPIMLIAYLSVLEANSTTLQEELIESFDQKTKDEILNVMLIQMYGKIAVISSVINVGNGQTIFSVSESKFKEIYADSSNTPPGLYCTAAHFASES